MTLKTVARSFCLKGHRLYTKFKDELSEMGKDLKIKQSMGGTYFIKKLCTEEQTFLGKFFGGCFTWGLVIRSCKGVVNG